MLKVTVNREHTIIEADGTPEEISTEVILMLIGLNESMKKATCKEVADSVIMAIIATTTKKLDISIDSVLRGIFHAQEIDG